LHFHGLAFFYIRDVFGIGSKLPLRKDIFANDMGVWKHLSSPSQYFLVKKNDSGGSEEVASFGKKKPKKMSSNMYCVRKYYSTHHAASN